MHGSILKKLLPTALIVAHLSLVSCKDDPSSSDAPQQPTVPPSASMTTDFSVFTSGGISPKIGETVQAGANFRNAAVRATAISSVVVAGLSVPVAAFTLAAAQTPTLGNDGKFHWRYSVTVGSNTYTADLTGWVDVPKQQSVWEMRISATNPQLDKFLWYDGRAKLDNSSGYWDFYDPNQPNNSVETIHIDWSYASNTNASLAFEVVKDGVPEEGDELKYDVGGNVVTIIYEDVSASQRLEISWNYSTHPGYLIAPDYNNGAKACWDETLNDVSCQ